MGMKKYLLVIILLLVWTGVDNILFGQTPTATVTVDQFRLCESGNIKMIVEFTGDAPFDFKYWINSGIIDQGFVTTAYNSYTFEFTTEFTKTGYLRFYDFSDTNGNPGSILDENGDPIVDGRIDIIVNNKPKPTINAPLRTCDLDVNLSATKEFESSTCSWRLENSSDGTLSDENITNPIFTAASEGIYTFFFTEDNDGCMSDEIAYSNYEVINTPSPSGGVIRDSETICAGEQATIDLNLVGEFPITVSYTDNVEGIDIYEFDTHQILTRELTSNETYQVYKLTSINGCETVINDDVDVHVDKMPNANAGTIDSPICGFEAVLEPILTEGLNSSGYWTLIDDNGGSGLKFDGNEISLDSDVQFAEEMYDLQWTEENEDNTDCYDTSVLSVTFYKIPESNIIKDTVEFYLARNLDLQAEEPLKGMKGLWEVIEEPSQKPLFVDADSSYTKVNNLIIGEYTFKWTVSNGEFCADYETPDEISISNKGIYKTTGFSPNGDGTNEIFIIGGAKNVAKNKLTVFDVTGKIVYQENNFCHPKDDKEIGWNGQKNDGNTEDGTYYYIFEGEGIDPIKSYLIIKGSKQ